MFQLVLVVAALQGTPPPIAHFRAIRAFQCDFGGGAGHYFEPAAAEENEERVITSPPFMYDDVRELTFDSIDYRALRARSLTKNTHEAVAVTVIPGDRLVSFVEVTATGVPIITSIVRTPRPLDPLHEHDPNSYFSVRSYQLLLSQRGDHAYQLEGYCKPLPASR